MRGNARLGIRRAAPSILLLAAAGCSLGGAAPRAVQHYQLEYPRVRGVADPSPFVLRVLPLQSTDVYERDRIMVREGTHRLESYNYRKWSIGPAQMIGDLLRRDLADSGMFRAVVEGIAPQPSDLALSGVLEEIEQRRDDGRCVAHLRIRFLLARQPRPSQAETLFQKAYRAAEPCRDGDVESLVAAMSEALAKISAELRGDIAAAIADVPVNESPR